MINFLLLIVFTLMAIHLLVVLNTITSRWLAIAFRGRLGKRYGIHNSMVYIRFSTRQRWLNGVAWMVVTVLGTAMAALLWVWGVSNLF